MSCTTPRGVSDRSLNRFWSTAPHLLLCSLASLVLATAAKSQSATPFCFGDGTSSVSGGNCPCGPLQNGLPGEGCMNSTGAGGLMTAAGNSCVTFGCGPDTLVLQGNQLPSTATCILIQSATPLTTDVYLGDGIRCIGGVLRRLYVDSAFMGQVRFPPSTGPSISAQSAALGDVIPPAGVRYYQIYYRDPAVAHCPPALFNITNGMTVTWR